MLTHSRFNLHARIYIPTCVKAYTVHVCTYELKSLCRAELWEQLFLCISGLPVWIREKAALPPLNVSWCLPGCLFWEEIKGEPLPLAPTKGERGVEGKQRGKGEETEVDDWVSIKSCIDGWKDRWIQWWMLRWRDTDIHYTRITPNL